MLDEKLCFLLNTLIKIKRPDIYEIENMFNNLVELQKTLQNEIMNKKQEAMVLAIVNKHRRYLLESQLENSKKLLIVKLANVLERLEDKPASVVDRFSRAEQLAKEINKHILTKNNFELTEECTKQSMILKLRLQRNIFEIKLRRFCKLSMEEEAQREEILGSLVQLGSLIESLKEVVKQIHQNNSKIEMHGEEVRNKLQYPGYYVQQTHRENSCKEQVTSMSKSFMYTKKCVEQINRRLSKLEEELHDVQHQLQSLELLTKKVTQRQKTFKEKQNQFSTGLCQVVENCANYAKCKISNIQKQLHIIVKKLVKSLELYKNSLKLESIRRKKHFTDKS